MSLFLTSLVCHHHILSRQCVIQAWALSVQSLRSWLVQCGPSTHSERMWSTVYFGFPHEHSLLGVNFHLCRMLAVLPTLALALLSTPSVFLAGLFLLGVVPEDVVQLHSQSNPNCSDIKTVTCSIVWVNALGSSKALS